MADVSNQDDCIIKNLCLEITGVQKIKIYHGCDG